ncbi:MAG: c-type cytochrome [Gemmatimonadota bacterium]
MGVLALMLALALAACGAEEQPRSGRQQRIQPATSPLRAPHPAYIQVGGQPAHFDTIRNPFEGDERALAEGERLYQQYNCISCHGGEGAGGIGPTLNDAAFKYGGSPAEIFQSIYEGRPNGMPVWGERIPDEQIWKLVAYVRSLRLADYRTVSWPGVPAEAGRTTPAR